MRRRRLPLLMALLAAAGCDDSAPPREPHVHTASDAGSVADARSPPDLDPHSGHSAAGAAMDASAAPSSEDEQRLLERGEYLVRHVSGCMECHTPRLRIGEFDETKLLSGVRELVDVEPDDDARGMLHSRNLTPDPETGLGEWTDDEIKNAFLHGKSRDDRVLHWTMPAWIYHNMSAYDVDAVVRYLRSIPEVRDEIPDSQPLSIELTEPYHLPEDVIPRSRLDPLLTEFEHAERGQYLATAAGLCIFCHSPPAQDPGLPVDVASLFMGRRKMIPIQLGSPAELEESDKSILIETRNLTPDRTGLGEWSATEVANALRFGVNRSGLPVCDPMPSAFGGSLLGMTEQDALDIGTYLTSLQPRDSGEIAACCTACHSQIEADAGAP